MNYTLGAPIGYDSMSTIDFSSNPYYNQSSSHLENNFRGNGEYIDPITTFSDDAHIPLEKKKDKDEYEGFRGGGGGGHGGGGMGGHGGGGMGYGGGGRGMGYGGRGMGYGGGGRGMGYGGRGMGGHHGNRGGYGRRGGGGWNPYYVGAGAVALGASDYWYDDGYYYPQPVQVVNEIRTLPPPPIYEESNDNSGIKIETIQEEKSNKRKSNKYKNKKVIDKNDDKYKKTATKKELDKDVLWRIIYFLIIIIIIIAIQLFYPNVFKNLFSTIKR
jgi:hypothetical protein